MGVYFRGMGGGSECLTPAVCQVASVQNDQYAMGVHLGQTVLCSYTVMSSFDFHCN